jgi:hypothetical protein
MAENHMDEILLSWANGFTKSDSNLERILRRRSKEHIIQAVVSEDNGLTPPLSALLTALSGLDAGISENIRPWNYHDFLARIRSLAS